MFIKSKNKAIFKKFLILFNIGLGAILLILIINWAFLIRPNQIALAIVQKQYDYYSLKDLPFSKEEIKNDYFGKSKIEEEAVFPDEETTEEATTLIEEELFEESEKITEKTNQLLNFNQQEQISLEQNTTKTLTLPIEEIKSSKDHPKIAIIVTNLGLNRRSTELALTLPTECALGFLPYTNSLKPLFDQAHIKGCELYLYLPMEVENINDNTERYTLMTNLSTEENIVKLNILLGSQENYAGVYSSFREVFTSQPSSFPVFDLIADKNLLFILGKEKIYEQVQPLKNYKNIIHTHIILDEESDREFISKRLEELIEIAEKNGSAIGYSQGFAITIEMIKDWLPTLSKRNIEIVPISTLKSMDINCEN